MVRSKKVDDCVKRTLASTTINSIGDVKNSLNECVRALINDTNNLSPDEIKAHKIQIVEAARKKSLEIEQRYGEKGEVYGYSPTEQKSANAMRYRYSKKHN